MSADSALRLALALVVAASLTLAACGGDDAGGTADGASEEELTAVKVGVLPLAAVAPIYIGNEQGFFEQEGLKVEAVVTQGGAEVVPSVMSGDMQFGYSNNVSLLIATAQGLPLEIVAEGNQEADRRADATDAIVVTGNSPIRSAKDLEGKTIGVNTLKNVGEVTIKTALQKRGVDISKLEFVEIPFPEMIPAVEAGRLDAGWVVEPFVTAAEAGDMRVLLNPFFETAERLSIATYFTSEQYAEENPEAVEGFVSALNRSFEYTQQHPDALRAAVLDFTEIPPPVAKAMNLPFFSAELNRESIELLAEKTEEFGVVESKPDLDALLPSGS